MRKGLAIAIALGKIGELVIGDVSYVGPAIADSIRVILGGVGNDSLTGTEDHDRLRGAEGDDTLAGLGGEDSLKGGAGSDILKGGAGNDLLDGGQGNDTLNGDADNDVLYGGEGNDLLDGGVGNDTLNGDADNDVLHGGEGDDLLAGGVGNDTLNGDAAKDVLQGGAGDDSLYGGAGDDLLDGGHGNDTLNGDADNDVLYGGEGNDLLDGGVGNDTLNGDADNDVLYGGEGGDLLDGGVGNDTLNGDSDNDVLRGGAGDDSLYGGTGDDVLDGGAGNDLLDGGQGNDTLNGDADNDILRGELGNDVLDGGLGNDTLNGDGDDDVLRGGAGDDWLYGGAGDDVLDGDSGNDQLFGGIDTEAGGGSDTFRFGRGGGQDTIHESVGGNDQDKIQLVGLFAREVSFSRVGNDLLISVIGTEDSLRVLRYFEGSARTVETIEFSDGMLLNKGEVLSRVPTNYIGGAGNDYLTGWTISNHLEGREGNDVLTGGNGYNLFIGGPGNDTMYGYSGKDNYVFNVGDGRDVLRDGTDYSFGGHEDQVMFGSGLGLSDIVFVARADLPVDDPEYEGNSSNDLIVRVRNSTDGLLITDFFTYGLIEHFSFADGSQLSASDVLERIKRTAGTDADDILRGGDGSDSIAALTGNDSAHGFGGNDSIDGGDGDDTLNGGEGHDYLVGGRGRDFLSGGDGNDTLIASSGDSMVDGGAGNDVIEIGGAGNPAGYTELQGGSGSDRYVLRSGMGNVAILDKDLAADAIDTIEFADLAVSDVSIEQDGYRLYISSLKKPGDRIEIYGLWDYSDSLTLLAPERVIDLVRFADGRQYTMDQIISMSFKETPYWESVRGTRGNDTINGGGGSDQVWGHVGDDVLRGGDGDDELYGMEGSDLLEGGAGNDTLYGGGWGSSDGGANTMNGGAGNDRSIGGDGDDVFVFGRGDGSDIIESQDSVGNDTLRFSIGVLPEHVQLYRDGSDLVAVIDGSSTQVRIKFFYTLADLPVEQVIFENGVFWSASEMRSRAITGDVNQLMGVAGDDVFIIDNTLDTVTELNGGGIDEIRSSVSYFLPENIENFTATGVLNLAIRGNSGDNVLRGNTSDNWFRGGGGNDRALGGNGDDTYYVEFSGTLSVEEYADEGNDTLRQEDGSWTYSQHYSLNLPDNVENLILGASSSWLFNGLGETRARGGYGNDLDNLIKGDRGVENVLDGYGGRDTLIGGSKVDVFRVDREDDVVIDYHVYDNGKNESVRTFHQSDVLFSGGDLVESSAVRYTLSDNLEHLLLVVGNAVEGRGNALDNVIVGNDSANRIEGGLGNDRLFDGRPRNTNWGAPAQPWEYAYDNDTLLGGDGDDELTAFYGSDYLDGGSGNDLLTAGGFATLTGGTGSDTLRGSGLGAHYRYGLGEGNDTIEIAYEGYVLADSRDILTFAADVLPDQVTFARVGEEGGDLLLSVVDGGSVLVRDFFLVRGEEGVRAQSLARIEFADGTVWSRDMIDHIVGLLEIPEGTDGNDVLFGSAENDLLHGLAGDDKLTGGAGDDWLDGGAGADTLDGGEGADTMLGGRGNDIYYVDNVNDQVIELADGGYDMVYASASFSAGDYIENVELTGVRDIDLVGSAGNGVVLYGNLGNNRVTGSSGNDELWGGDGGVDTLSGGAGDDVYIITDVQDVVIEQGGGGTDTYMALVDGLTLASNVERVYMMDIYTPVRTIYGNQLGNRVYGSPGDNLIYGMEGLDNISGGGGNDTIVGGRGTDMLSGGAGNDTYLFNPGDGMDVVTNGDAAGFDLLRISGVTESQIWLSIEGTDVGVSVIGTGDAVYFRDWFSNPSSQIDAIQLDNGKVLGAAQVANLIEAMSAFAPPSQTTLPAGYQSALNAVIAANWV